MTVRLLCSVLGRFILRLLILGRGILPLWFSLMFLFFSLSRVFGVFLHPSWGSKGRGCCYIQIINLLRQIVICDLRIYKRSLINTYSMYIWVSVCVYLCICTRTHTHTVKYRIAKKMKKCNTHAIVSMLMSSEGSKDPLIIWKKYQKEQNAGWHWTIENNMELTVGEFIKNYLTNDDTVSRLKYIYFLWDYESVFDWLGNYCTMDLFWIEKEYCLSSAFQIIKILWKSYFFGIWFKKLDVDVLDVFYIHHIQIVFLT